MAVQLFGLEDKSPQGNFIKEFEVKEVQKYDYLIIKELVKLWLKSEYKTVLLTQARWLVKSLHKS